MAISPAQPGPNADLVVTVVTASTDPEGEAVSYRYLWQLDGADQADLTGETVPTARTEEGQTWRVVVTPSDGELDGPAGESTVTVANLPPDVPQVHIEPEVPNPREALTRVWDAPPSDPNGDAVTTRIEWYRNGTLVVNWDDLTTIESVYVAGGDLYQAVVTVSDGVATSTATAEVRVTNTPPTLELVEIRPDPATDDDNLTAVVEADDPEGSSLAYRYVWYRDGVEATEVGDVATVEAIHTSPGEVWDVEVFVSDPLDTVSGRATETRTIIPFNGWRMTEYYSAVLTSDGAGGWTGASGYWSAEIQSCGSAGENDRAVAWDYTAIENSARCPTCDFAFSATYTFDTDSVITTGCPDAAEDGRGYFTFDISSDQFVGYMTGGLVSADSRDTTMSLRRSGDQSTYRAGRPIYYAVYTTDYAYDAYGNVTIDIWRYRIETQ